MDFFESQTVDDKVFGEQSFNVNIRPSEIETRFDDICKSPRINDIELAMMTTPENRIK